MLGIVHLGIATATKLPELALDSDDEKTLASAVLNVADQFDIRPDPKVEAILGLIVAAGVVYGPKVVMIRERKKEEKAE